MKVKVGRKSYDVTDEHKSLGADAFKQKEDGHNPPNWAVDEDIWEKAKTAARKSYDESEDVFWPSVVTIYESMGGEVGAIEPQSRGTVRSQGNSDGVKRSWEKRKALSYSEKSESASAHSDLAHKASEKADSDDDEETHRAAAMAHLNAMDKHSMAADYAKEDKRDEHLTTATEHEDAMLEHMRKADQKKKAKARSSHGDKLVNAARMIASVPVGQITSLITEAAKGDSRFDHNLQSPYAGGMLPKPYCCDVLMPEDDGGELVAVIRTDAGETVKIPFTFDGKSVTISKGTPEPTTGIWLYTRETEEKRLVHSRSASVQFDSVDAPKAFMWMPGGVSTIEATWNEGKPIRLTIECDDKTAETVNASFQRWRERYPKQKPFGDVEHNEREAAFWPEKFEWQDEPEPGVFCSVESWSDLGERNVKGKIHRSFSPSFSTDADYDSAKEDSEGVLYFPDGVRGSESNPARVTGVGFAVGCLTNKPAFKNILPVRASRNGPAADATNKNAEEPKRTMKIKLTKARGTNTAGTVIELPDAEAVKAIADGEALDLRSAEIIEARESEIKAQKEQVRKVNEGRIDTAITAAKERFAVEPKNEDVRAKAIAWLDKSSDPDLIVEYINGLQPKKDLQTLATRSTTSDDGTVRASITGYKPGISESCLAYVRARQPMDKLIRAGDFKGAFDCSRESSAIFSADIKAIMSSGGDFRLKDAVRAADVTDGNLGTLATGLILMRNLGYLKAKLAWLPYVSTDLRNEPALFNQPVFTRYITPPDAVQYNTSTGWAASTAKSTDVTVTMDQHWGVEIRFQTQMLASTMRNLFAEQQGAQFYSLALKINRHFLATLMDATWAPTLVDGTTAVGPYIKALGDWDIKSLVGVKNKMTLSQIEDTGRFAILHSTYHDKLLEDSNLVLARTIQSALNKGESDALTEGTLPPLFGIQPLESQLMTDDEAYDGDSNGDPTVVGFAGNVSSMLFVARVPQDYTKVFPDIPSTAAIEIATEPDSGLSIMFVKYVNHQLANVSARCALMWGDHQGDPRRGFFIQKKA